MKIKKYHKKKFKVYKQPMSSLEIKINDYLISVNAPFIYGGDNSFCIEAHYPDWYNIKDKKIILASGCFYHGCVLCHSSEKYRKLIQKRYIKSCKTTARYVNAGWKVLEIWEHELKDGNWKDRIDKFLQS